MTRLAAEPGVHIGCDLATVDVLSWKPIPPRQADEQPTSGLSKGGTEDQPQTNRAPHLAELPAEDHEQYHRSRQERDSIRR